ncbi:MAG: S49 family peptidase [Pseudomonadota bacterium]
MTNNSNHSNHNNPSNQSHQASRVPAWSLDALEKVLIANVEEQRRRRRWGIFFNSVFLCLLAILVFSMLPINYSNNKQHKPHVALIDLHGTVSDSGGIDADSVATSLKEAYDDKNTKAVILRINSPGGTPVQAAYIYDEVRRMEKLYPAIPVYAVCTDVCASAAYYIASAANQIYANPASLVGSIGVLIDDFGFPDTLKKFGVQRRLITSGSRKGFLDPFSPLSKADQQYAVSMLNDVHQQFIQSVQNGRGKRLKQQDPLLFSGLPWTGKQAIKLGLIDGFGSTGYVAREII